MLAAKSFIFISLRAFYVKICPHHLTYCYYYYHYYYYAFFFFQHYLTMIGGTLTIPFVLSVPMCFANNTLAISEVFNTLTFVSGIVTLVQSTFGIRYVLNKI